MIVCTCEDRPRRSPAWPSSWNVKRVFLLDRLDAGFDDVVWLDSDVVLTGDFRRSWGALPRETFIVATGSKRAVGRSARQPARGEPARG